MMWRLACCGCVLLLLFKVLFDYLSPIFLGYKEILQNELL